MSPSLCSRRDATAPSLLLWIAAQWMPLPRCTCSNSVESSHLLESRCRLAGVKAIVCIVGIIAGGRLLVRPLYRRISNLQNSDVFAATTLLVVLGTSVLTQAAGLSLALGAFLVSWAVLNILVLSSQNRRRAAGGARH